MQGVARSYYAAGVFFDVLGMFEASGVEEASLEKELIEQRRKYCKWRAALILSAAKKGEDLPEPVAEEMEDGVGGGDEGVEVKEEETKEEETKMSEEKDDFGIPEAPSGGMPNVAPVFIPSEPPPPAYPSPPKQEQKRGSWFGGAKRGGDPSKAAVADAIELSKVSSKSELAPLSCEAVVFRSIKHGG